MLPIKMFFLFLFITTCSFAQKSGNETELFFSYTKNGESMQANIAKGDTLVYHCQALAMQYDINIIVNEFKNGLIDLTYQQNISSNKWHVRITGSAYKNTRNYTTFFSSSRLDMSMTDSLVFWMSLDNFKEVAFEGTTLLKIDSYPKETFVFASKPIDTPIKYKGESVTIRTFTINNRKNMYEDPTRTMTLLDDSRNRLIVGYVFGSKSFGSIAELTEIR